MYQRGVQERYDYPDGEALNRGTLERMAALVRRASEHPRIRGRAMQVIAEVPSADYDGQIRAVWDFVRANVHYVRDPLGCEYLTDPIELDCQVDEGTAGEDCESLTSYAAALLASIGIRSEFEPMEADVTRPGELSHVGLVVLQPRTGREIPFDLVGPTVKPGFDLGNSLVIPGKRVERWTLDGEPKKKETPTMATLAGVVAATGFGDVQSTITDVSSSTAQGAAQGAAFGPWGAVVGGVLNLAGSIVSAATGKPIGTALPGGPVPLASIGVQHSVELPTVSRGAKNTAMTVGIVAVVAYVGLKILRARRGGR